MVSDTFFVPLKTSVLFCLARKVPKEHTVIQGRDAPPGTTASGAALGIGSRGVE